MRSVGAPVTVVFCHCIDCKRWTGSPAPAFAAFEVASLQVSPALGEAVITNPGVGRWNCPNCSSPLGATFDYLPDQIYVPLGLIDQAEALPAQIHCYGEQQLPWLHIQDDAPREAKSARATLTGDST